ncbi:MAG: cyclase family protein [Bacteroidetes bacterium]|nr:cyclase family protein [Bacteroidota bacterium]
MQLYLDPETYIDTAAGMDISIPLSADSDSVRAWYCDPVKIEPVITAQFVGDVNRGGSVNFRNIMLNPHGNGTHTECVGHISKENFTINQCLREFHFKAQLISVAPQVVKNEQYNQQDQVITKELVEEAVKCAGNAAGCNALIIRTADNTTEKRHRNYSNTNPAYLTTAAIQYILDLGIDHLVVDLPSVDRENDGGELAAHHLFWNYPQNPWLHKTITEMVFVPDAIKDDVYFLNIQIASLESDASPAKLVLFEIRTR